MKRNTPVSPPTLISLEAAKLKVGLTGVSTFMISVLQLLWNPSFFYLFLNEKEKGIPGSCTNHQEETGPVFPRKGKKNP